MKTTSKPPQLPLTDEELYQKSYATALRLLARREHSVLELRHKLLGRDFPEQQVAKLLGELVDAGYLSDARYADVYVRSRFERGFGPQRIRAELRERGIDDSLMAAPLAELADRWLNCAMQERDKRFGRQLPEDFKTRARQMRFLQQRGFTGEQIRDVFREKCR